MGAVTQFQLKMGLTREGRGGSVEGFGGKTERAAGRI